MIQIVIDRESHKLLRAVSVTQDSDKCNNKIIFLKMKDFLN